MEQKPAEITVKKTFSYRFFEMVPGLISWAVIASPFVLSFVAPRVVAYFILAYTIYWAVQSFAFVVNAVRGYINVGKWKQMNWMKKLDKDFHGKWEDIYYVTLIPFAKETERVLIPTIDSVVSSEYPKEKKILLLSSEAKCPDGKPLAERLAKKYQKDFYKVIVTEHVLAEGEVTGKSSNENWAGRLLSKLCQEWGIDSKKVLITSSDADMSVNGQYVPACVHQFLSQPEETRHSTVFQPIPTDHKNVWDTSAVVALRVMLGTMWRSAVFFMPSMLTVYSHYTMSLKALEDVGFWDADIIQEDIRTHSKFMFRFGSKFRIIPIYFIVEGEPVIGKNMGDTLWLHYKQVRRWAWGAAEFAYIMDEGLLRKNKANKLQVLFYAFQFLRTNLDWVLISYVPLACSAILFALNPQMKVETLGRNLPLLLNWILSSTTVILFLFVIMEFYVMPKPPEGKKGPIQTILRLAKWVLSPYIGVFLSSIPALDAQTRLIFNKRLAYVVYRKE